MHVRPLGTLEAEHLAQAGAKAVTLARLQRAGLPVPPACCVTAPVYRQYLEMEGRLDLTREVLRVLQTAELPPALTRLRAALQRGVMPAGLEAALEEHLATLGPGPWAVRSSATAEDLPHHSFAGQHDSVLHVDTLAGCLAAIRRCWASVWSDRAVAYRQHAGVDHGRVDMAVLVQQQVVAQVAGVLFTADPVRPSQDYLIVEASPGVGEQLVAGRVSPHRLVLRREDLALVHEEGPPCLAQPRAQELARLGLEAERVLGAPVDVEWALDADGLQLLQARPITTGPRHDDPEQRQIWTNVNAGEVLPDVVTPLTWSIMIPVVDRLFGAMLEPLGLSLRGLSPIGLVAGRAYFNLNTVVAVLRALPGSREDRITELFGGRQEVALRLRQETLGEADLPPLRCSAWQALRGLPLFLLDLLTCTRARGERILATLRREVQAETQEDFSTRSPEELKARIQRTLEGLIFQRAAFHHMGVTLTHQGAFQEVCQRWFPEPGSTVASQLLAGLGTNEVAAAGLELWRLARLARGRPEVRQILRQTRPFAALRPQLEALPGGVCFLQRWDAFMTTHGHHCRAELELANPRWSERPDHVLAKVRAFMEAPESLDAVARQQLLARRRQARLRDCRRRLRGPGQRLVFSFLLRQAQLCSPFRENLKSLLVRRLAHLRRLVLCLAHHLTRQGALPDVESVFFLQLEELLRGDISMFRSVTAERRARHERHLTLDPPTVVVGRYDPARHPPDALTPGVTVLHGVPVNPGLVTGPARVILRADMEQVQPGEILVAPYTDPGWTPHFLHAAALVTDLGGLLSHGSIVAREYGLPAVVNTGEATRRIHNGQQLRVDGARGTVHLLE